MTDFQEAHILTDELSLRLVSDQAAHFPIDVYLINLDLLDRSLKYYILVVIKLLLQNHANSIMRMGGGGQSTP